VDQVTRDGEGRDIDDEGVPQTAVVNHTRCVTEFLHARTPAAADRAAETVGRLHRVITGAGFATIM
jgi:hypothetical protein